MSKIYRSFFYFFILSAKCCSRRIYSCSSCCTKRICLNLCRECFNDVNGENAHSDYGHDEAVAGGDYWPRGCEKCRAAAEDAKIIATFKAINAADHKRDAEEAGEGR